jgi:hypothetical protein
MAKRSLPLLSILSAVFLLDLAHDINNIHHESLHAASHFLMRAVCMVACISLASFLSQLKGLIGSAGLIPISSSLKAVREVIDSPSTSNPATVQLLKIVHYKFHSPSSAQQNTRLTRVVFADCLVCLLGALFPHPVLLLYIWVAVYALKRVSGPFLNYQWDSLLLECLGLCVVLSLASGDVAVAVGVW